MPPATHPVTGSPRLDAVLLAYLEDPHVSRWPGADGLTTAEAIGEYLEAAAARQVPGARSCCGRSRSWRRRWGGSSPGTGRAGAGSGGVRDRTGVRRAGRDVVEWPPGRRCGMKLDKELATFRPKLPRLLESHTGEYAQLIHGDEVAGFYPSDEEAYDAGVERFGLGAFPDYAGRGERAPPEVVHRHPPRCLASPAS